MKTKNIGIKVDPPNKECDDKKCPFHGRLRLNGRIFIGKISKVDLNRSATVEFMHFYYLSKYERYEKRISRIKVHNPPCINAKILDKVRIVETRKISKTKNFVIVEVIKK